MTDILTTPKVSSLRFPKLRTIHKIAAFIALSWLSVLGLSGWILDHHEWRWSHQWSVPKSWTSPGINRLIRGTIMRDIEIDPANPEALLGGSERGLWFTSNSGKTWADVIWEESEGRRLSSVPQVYDFVSGPSGDLNHVWIATDDGIWIVKDQGTRAVPFALRGTQVTSLTTGSSANELLGVAAESRLFQLSVGSDPNIGNVTWIDLTDVVVAGLPDHIDLGRFVFELHLGRGFLPQPWSKLINDYGGVAIVFLSLTGLMYWWLPRRWQHQKPKGKVKLRQNILRWLYRSHGPTIGLLGAIPILYLSLTGLALDHATPFLEAAKTILLNRANLTPIYNYTNLTGEVSNVVGFANEPQRLLIATRFGPLQSFDGGKTWAVDNKLPRSTDGTDAGRTNVFRQGDYVFVGIGGVGQFYKRDSETVWTEIILDGPKLAITDAAQHGDAWYLKNSRAIYTGSLSVVNSDVVSSQSSTALFTDTSIAFPPLSGASVFLFVADIHTGSVIHSKWEWINDLIALLAIVLVCSGPILWWRRKWM